MSKQNSARETSTVLMKIQSEVKNAAKDFLPVEVINEFIALIKPWEKTIECYFFQITGKTDPIRLEFGCHAGNVLVDITFSEKDNIVNLITVPSIDRIQLNTTPEAVQLSIISSGNQALFYESSTGENRESLKNYAGHLMMIIGR